jgi:hypothetical protein
MADNKQIVHLLEQLSVSDNVARSAAEKQYEAMKADPSILPYLPLSILAALSDETAAAHTRQLAAVLLRRMLLEQEVSVYRVMDAEM